MRGECTVDRLNMRTRSSEVGDFVVHCDLEGIGSKRGWTSSIGFTEPKSTQQFSNLFEPEKGLQKGLLLRMVYFSSVTATTLGYGEIVPLTGLARVVVAIESVLGLVLMGTLVVWVTAERKQSIPKTPRSPPSPDKSSVDTCIDTPVVHDYAVEQYSKLDGKPTSRADRK